MSLEPTVTVKRAMEQIGGFAPEERRGIEAAYVDEKRTLKDWRFELAGKSLNRNLDNDMTNKFFNQILGMR